MVCISLVNFLILVACDKNDDCEEGKFCNMEFQVNGHCVPCNIHGAMGSFDVTAEFCTSVNSIPEGQTNCKKECLG